MKKKQEPVSRFTGELKPGKLSPITDEEIALVERVTGHKVEVAKRFRATPSCKEHQIVPAE